MKYPGRLIKLNDEGEVVKQIQARLGVQQTGRFGPTTHHYVVLFQQREHLVSDGVVGPKTWEAMFPVVVAIEKALAFTLRWEGGFVNHPDDPGGRTNKGIIQSTYNTYRRNKSLQVRSVVRITDEEVRDIYESMYWRPAGCDSMELPMAIACFDTAVNCGLGGLKSIKSRAKKGGSALDEALAICEARNAYYDRIIRRNGRLATFKRGWTNRVNALKLYLKKL